MCLRASLALVATHRSFCQIRYTVQNLASWMCEVVSGIFTLGGRLGMKWWAKVKVQVGLRA